MIKYSILAGKFDPPHYGHCFAIDTALTVNPKNIILICPQKYNDTVEMSKLLFSHLYPENSFEIINYNYSHFVDLLEYLTMTLKQTSFNIIIDSKVSLVDWKRYGRIIDENTFTIVERKLDISSSLIRTLCKNKEYASASKFTSKEVIEYIKDNNLYQRS